MKQMCDSACGWKGWALLVVGVLYLAQDLGWGFASWWNLNWWTVAFLLWGLCHVSKKW